MQCRCTDLSFEEPGSLLALPLRMFDSKYMAPHAQGGGPAPVPSEPGAALGPAPAGCAEQPGRCRAGRPAAPARSAAAGMGAGSPAHTARLRNRGSAVATPAGRACGWVLSQLQRLRRQAMLRLARTSGSVVWTGSSVGSRCSRAIWQWNAATGADSVSMAAYDCRLCLCICCWGWEGTLGSLGSF